MCMDPTGEQLDATARDAPICTYTYMKHTHKHARTGVDKRDADVPSGTTAPDVQTELSAVRPHIFLLL